MTETVPTRPLENTSNGRVPHAQVTIAVDPPTPDKTPRLTVADHVIGLLRSKAIVAGWCFTMAMLVEGVFLTHGAAHAMLITAVTVLYTQFSAAWVVWLLRTPRTGR